MSTDGHTAHTIDDKHEVGVPYSVNPEQVSTKDGEGLRDVATDLFLEIQNYSAEELQSERATVRRKLDMVIMPMLVS